MAETPLDPSLASEAEETSHKLRVADHDQMRLIDRLPSGSPGLRTPTPHEPLPGLRVRKDKLKLASTSENLSGALTALTEQIRQAEQFLRKQPGADRAQVALDHLDLTASSVGTEAFLEARRDSRGNCRIVVSYYNSQDNTCVSTSELDDFPVATRIELCQSIPELIERAAVAQTLVVGDVLGVADAIEQTLQRYRENRM